MAGYDRSNEAGADQREFERWEAFHNDFATTDATDQADNRIRYYAERLASALSNPALQDTVMLHLKNQHVIDGINTLNSTQPNQVEEQLKKSEGSKRHLKRGRRQRKEKTPSSPSSSSSSSPERGRKRSRSHRRTHRRRRSSSSSTFSPSPSRSISSSDEEEKRKKSDKKRKNRYGKKKKTFTDGAKSVPFSTYDGRYGNIDAVLNFIHQFDAAFGGENFTESSKVRRASMHLVKTAKQWWTGLKIQRKHPTSWKRMRTAIMEAFLPRSAKDKVLSAWRSLQMLPGDSMQNYVDKFWDAYLKASVFRRIDFQAQRQQFCAGLPELVEKYVSAFQPKTLTDMFEHSWVAADLYFIDGKASGGKRFISRPGRQQNQSLKQSEQNSQDERNGDINGRHSNRREQGKLTPEEMLRYRQERLCFTCGEKGHQSLDCPHKKTESDPPSRSQS